MVHLRIADHAVDLVLPEGVTLPANYEPFVVEGAVAPVLTLQVEMGLCPLNSEEGELFFTDKQDEDMPRIEVRHWGESWLIGVAMRRDLELCCHLLASADFSKATLWCEPEVFRFALDNASMLTFAFRTASLGTLEMHASVPVLDGQAQLFLGHSGTGKSTHSRLWLETYPEAWLLNDDNPVLRLMPDGEVRVYGTPWSGKTPCYHQAWAPVRGIVKLSQAPENQIREMRLPEAYAYMLSSASGLKMLPEMMDCLYHTIATIIQSVKMRQLNCLPDHDAARLCHDELFA